MYHRLGRVLFASLYRYTKGKSETTSRERDSTHPLTRATFPGLPGHFLSTSIAVSYPQFVKPTWGVPRQGTAVRRTTTYSVGATRMLTYFPKFAAAPVASKVKRRQHTGTRTLPLMVSRLTEMNSPP